MRTLEWDNKGVKIDDPQLHHLRFAEGIVHISPNISQAERMLADFDKFCEKNGLRINLTKRCSRGTHCSRVPLSRLTGRISPNALVTSLGREINMLNSLAPELAEKRSGLGSFQEHRGSSE
ncbi:unnamed protein product [Angiostrongylus costaricensis]|uniref:Reverse transcriptase domain-containing protein n=1 Tax=Angiostrongylus costaricensis TaxID=334426 RepID=A0A0R3PTQ8_ANGCS|nr:unnamed protein product [Angiostrongylus costaricensis]